jgi:hypothetical protein
VVVLLALLEQAGQRQDITVSSFGRHLECYSDGTNWIIMRSSGDVSSITATTLGLGNVANTRPSDLPISNAVSSAMTLKANLSGANFTGSITAPTIHATTSLLVGGTNLNDIYLRTSNFNGSINNYLLTNNFTGSINNYLRTDNFIGSINNYLRTDNFTGSINNYLLTNNFTGSINNYLRIDNFNGSINNYLRTVNFTGSINNYLLTNNFTGSINNYLKTN